MSISSPQGGGSKSQPGAVRVTAGGPPKPPGNKPPTRPTGGGGGGGSNRRRPPVVVVKPQRNWTVVWVASLVGVIALGIVGYAVYNSHENGLSWEQRADKISGVVDYRKSKPAILTTAYRNHVEGAVKYETTPPAYGNHNPDWQRCMGDVYDAAIPNENAVHALEHGAVWITYDPTKINATQVAQMAKTYVNGNDFTLMSPYPGQPTAISLQGWGLQLQLTSPTDTRIAQFLQDVRQNATLEAGTPCSSGTFVTGTGSTPHNIDTQPSAAPSAPASTPAS